MRLMTGGDGEPANQSMVDQVPVGRAVGRRRVVCTGNEDGHREGEELYCGGEDGCRPGRRGDRTVAEIDLWRKSGLG
jgi:hypothetical protein